MNRMDGNCHQNCGVSSKFLHQDASISKRIAKIPFYMSRTYVEPRLSTSVDAYFAISPAVKEIYSDIGLPADRISVIPEFYDPAFASEIETTYRSSDQDTLQLLYVGRIEPMKGVDCLINALNRTKSVELTVVGDGSALTELRSLVASHRLKDRVSFEGWVPHSKLPSYYQGADLFVHPARLPEPFGRTLLESMQLQTPAIVSDIGSLSWVVEDAGRIFPPNDEIHLANILSQLQQDDKQLKKLQDACSSQVEKFNPKKVVSAIEQQYEQC